MAATGEPAWLRAHLARCYDLTVERSAELDDGVFRVDDRGGASWVARVFDDRTVSDVQRDADILNRLAAAGFPAERCGHAEPVSEHDATAVLLTQWVDGDRSDGRGRTFGVLGFLLGRLHSHTAATLPAGGAWHHLVARGGPRDEIAAAIELFESVERRVRPEQHAIYDDLLDELEHLDDGHDLPHAFVHPDFVPPNAITTPDDHRVIIDWAGAGRGPRLWSLALLLWAGGMRDLRLVDVAMSRYARHVTLDPAELDRLESIIPARPLTMDIWSFAHGRRELPAILANLTANRTMASRIAERVQELAATATD